MRENIQTILGKLRRGTVLNYGPSKTGKTRSLITLIRYLKSVGLPYNGRVFDCDYGIDPLVNLLYKEPDMKPDDVIIYRYGPAGGDRVGEDTRRPREQGKKMFQDFLRDFNSLYDMYDSAHDCWRPNAENPPAWIAIDTLTSLQDWIFDFIVQMRGGKEPGTPGGPDGRQVYGTQMEKVVEIIKSSLALPLYAVWNMHEKKIYRETLNADGSKSEVLDSIEPLVTGKSLPGQLPKDFSVVLYSQASGDKYWWKTKGDGLIKTAGTRFHEGLPLQIAQDYKLVL